MITEEECSELVKKKQNLYRQLDRKEITDNEYKNQIQQIEEEIKRYINNVVFTQIENNKMEEKNMANEKLVEKKQNIKPKKEIKEKKINITSLIIKALGIKSCKNAEGVADKVIEWDSSLKKEDIIKKAKGLLNYIKEGKEKRWEAYIWNEDEFLLTKK